MVLTMQVLLLLICITLDGVFGVLYSIILAGWMVTTVSQAAATASEKELRASLKYISIVKYFSLITCYCGVLWKLNLFVQTYRGVVLILNGYVTKYSFLSILVFLIEIALFMLAVYVQEAFDSVLSAAAVPSYRLTDQQRKSASNNDSGRSSSTIVKLIGANHFGLTVITVFIFAGVWQSLTMLIPITIMIIATPLSKQVSSSLSYQLKPL